jgi:hypothetical protein
MNFSEMKQEFSIFHRSLTRREKLTLYFFMGTALSLFIAVWIMSPIQHVLSSEGKGLKVFLTVDSNHAPQQGLITTYQYGQHVDSRYQFIEQGRYEYTLNYQKGQIDNGQFKICVAITDGVYGCADSYNGIEKDPVYVALTIQGSVNGDSSEPQGQSQAQSSNNENENSNALSQSQETTIWICKEGGCTAQ